MECTNTDTVSILPIALLFTQVYSPAPSLLVFHVCFLFFFPVCMCACISVCGMVSVCTCGCGGQRLTSGVPLVIHPIIMFACNLEQGPLPTSWSSLTAPDRLASEPQASSCSLFSKQLQVQQVLYRLSHLSSSWWCSLVREINYGSEGKVGPGLLESSWADGHGLACGNSLPFSSPSLCCKQGLHSWWLLGLFHSVCLFKQFNIIPQVGKKKQRILV